VFHADGRAGVITALEGVLEGKPFRAQTSGRYKIAATTADTWSAGDDVFWDADTSKLTDDGDGNAFVGTAEAAKTNGQTTNIVILNRGVRAVA
jgi:predicted RecA/RadA family phage recombinase